MEWGFENGYDQDGWIDPDGRSRDVATYAVQLVKEEFPEVILQSRCPFRGVRQGKRTQFMTLQGPDVAVRAFLSSVALARDLDSLQIVKFTGPETGDTFSEPIKDFRAWLTLRPSDDVITQQEGRE